MNWREWTFINEVGIIGSERSVKGRRWYLRKHTEKMKYLVIVF